MKHLSLICIAMTICTFAHAQAPTTAQNQYSHTDTWHIGGAGRWDYVTVSDQHLYVTRSTHTQVIDLHNGKVVGDISPQGGAHGTAIAPRQARGFISDGKAAEVIIFDLHSYKVLGKIKAAEDADGIIYDPFSDRVFAACGDAGVIVPIDANIDPATGKADPAIDLAGKPEFLAADGAGKLYVNINDKSEVVAIDIKTSKVTARWPITPGEKPTGIAIDPEHRQLFVGCRNQKLIVLSTDDGHQLADVSIGKGVDAVSFDDGKIFASCADGTMSVIAQNSAGKFELVQSAQTAVGARTMAIDPATHTAYLPTAEFEPANGAQRPAAKPDTFQIIVMTRPN